MGVFIAWSEDRSEALARYLQRWLPKVLPGIAPGQVRISLEFRPGADWLGELRRALAESEIAIVCLTRENLAKPWLHFEAGAVSASLRGQGSVIPLLLDAIEAEELPAALGHFQAASAFSKGDMWEVVRSIRAAAAPGTLVRDARTRFREEWPDFERHRDEVRRIRSHAEHLVVYMPSLKRNPFFAELFDHIVRMTTQLRRDLPIHVRQSELVGSVLANNTAQVLTEVATRYPGAVVIMFPPTRAAYDSIRQLDPDLAVNLIMADIHPTAKQWQALHGRRFFRKLIVVDNAHGARLAAAKVARGPHAGSTAVNVLTCEGDFHRRGRVFRAELRKLAASKRTPLKKVVWLDQLTELRFALAMDDASRHVRQVLRRHLDAVRRRPTYVFCANDSMALGARSAVARFCRAEHRPIKIVSFDASDIVRDSIRTGDPYLWCSVDQRYAEYAQALIDAALAILDGRGLRHPRKTIKPTLLC